MEKHSVSIRGHATSFSLEKEFWGELKTLAKERNISLAQLVTQIDTKRTEGQNLSSAIRIFVLKSLKSGLT
ncbi:MAG: ribbon-helix-helix domain-containing protein [Rhizobiaceae bacterium]